MIINNTRGEILRSDGQVLTEMTQIDILLDFAVCVYGSEGPVAHFHVLKGNSKYPDWETCIEIRHPKYFHHFGKESILNSKQKKDLMTFLSAPHKYFSTKSNWQVLVIVWSMNNTEHQISPIPEMPDYMLL